jgi:hypothetical protein
MTWLHLVSYFFGGMFMANAIPHFVSGIMGPALPNSLRKAARRRSFLVYGERSVGLLQRDHRLPSRGARWQLRSEIDK